MGSCEKVKEIFNIKSSYADHMAKVMFYICNLWLESCTYFEYPTVINCAHRRFPRLATDYYLGENCNNTAIESKYA